MTSVGATRPETSTMMSETQAGLSDAESTASTPMLHLHQVEVVYGHLSTAVSQISITVPRGEITAIMGTNGAGKSTVLKAIAGFPAQDDAQITDGRIEFDGMDITGTAPHQTSKMGIALVPERGKVFESLSVKDNLLVAAGTNARNRTLVKEIEERFPMIEGLRDRRAGLLSGGQRQMVGIAMALSRSPTVLLVDELSLGLAPVLVQSFMTELKRLRDALQLTIVLVEQNVMAALAIADRGYVMEGGRVVFDGTASELANHEDVREFYLGIRDGESETSYRNVKQYSRQRRWWS